MNFIQEFDSFRCGETLLESKDYSYFPKWKDGGILLIRGLPQKDGLTRLYATRVKRVFGDGIRGNFKAHSFGDFFIILKKHDGQFDLGKILATSEVLERAMGLRSMIIPLDNKQYKTPIWQKSIGEFSFPKFLRDEKMNIDSIPGIYFPPVG